MSEPARPRPENQTNELPRWVWLYFPPVLALILFVAALVDPESARQIVTTDHHGGGLAEHATVVILLPGIFLGFAAGYQVLKRDVLCALWLVIWALGALYFALEEASWGQWYFGWDSPEFFKNVNKQQETNLHNIHPWLDRKPRVLLEYWMLAMGLVYPAVMLVRDKPSPTGRFWWIYPSVACLPTAAIYLAVRACRWFDVPHFRSTELREYYIALFVTLFIASLWWRSRSPHRISHDPKATKTGSN